MTPVDSGSVPAGQHPVPDDKDWTWTLSKPCPQCGLSAGEVDVADVASRAELAAAEWVQILTSHPAVTARPQPQVWSALEYGAHVRDVYRIFDARLVMMLMEDNPTFDNWDQDQTAIDDRYFEQDPDQVADDLAAAAAVFVARLRALEPSQLERRGRRTDGAQFTVGTFAQYFLHDVIHHLWDVTGQQDGVESLRDDTP